MAEKKKKEKECPLPCLCGKPAATVWYAGKKMVSCPNPEKCRLGERTTWHKLYCDAIHEWNGIIRAANYKEGRYGYIPADDTRQAAGTE